MKNVWVIFWLTVLTLVGFVFLAPAHARPLTKRPAASLSTPRSIIPAGVGWQCFTFQDKSLGGRPFSIGDKKDVVVRTTSLCERTLEECSQLQMSYMKRYPFSDVSSCGKQERAWVFTFFNREDHSWYYRASNHKPVCEEDRLHYKMKKWEATRLSKCLEVM